MKRHRVSTALVAWSCCAVVALMGCSTDSTADQGEVQRAAEGVMKVEPDATSDKPLLKADEPPANGAIDEAEPVQAVFRGVRVCVINARSPERRPFPRLNVFFTKADRVSRESSLVAPGDALCGEAEHSSAKYDVSGEINVMYDESKPMKFNGTNSVSGVVGEIGWNFSIYPCAVVTRENDTSIYDDGEVRFTLTRLDDSQDYKEFSITVSESQGATPVCRS